MGKKTKKGKGRLDKWYELAKTAGFRSRAAYKLIQLNRKFAFLESARACLDLCAAPGGWLQVAAKTMPVASLIIGIDLVPIKPIRGVKTLVGDITEAKSKAAIRAAAKGSLFDVVIHDGAPNVGGAWASEAYSQAALVLDSLKLATEFLAPKGTFVTKVFRSKEYTPLLYALQQLFEKVEATKPVASRNTSAEIFVVCMKYKAPAKIDPRLLDHRVLFQEVSDAPRAMGPDALLRQRHKEKRNREGYEDGLSTLHKPMSAATFVLADHAVELLANRTAIVIDGPGAAERPAGTDEEDAARYVEAAARIRGHEATTREVRELCGDLQVLGRRELKQLLKWRLEIRKDMSKEEKKERREEAAEDGAGAEAGEGAAAADQDAKMLKEMERLRARMEARERRERKKKRLLKRKQKIKRAQAANAGEIAEEQAMMSGLFSLKDLKSRAHLDAAADAAAPEPEDFSEEPSSDEDDADLLVSDTDSSDDDSGDDDRRKYEEMLEELVDRSWEQYKRGRQAKGEVPHIDDIPRKKFKGDQPMELGGEDDVIQSEKAVARAEELARRRYEKAQARARLETEEGGGLVVELDPKMIGVRNDPKSIAERWFSQDIFKEMELEEDVEELAQRREAAHARADADESSSDSGAVLEDDDVEDEEDSGRMDEDALSSEDEETLEIHEMKRRAAQGGGGVGVGGGGGAGAGGFEVVPAEEPAGARRRGSDSDADSEETDSEDEFDALPKNAQAEVMAMARKMIRNSTKHSMMEAAYNRYAFHDENLPEWFENDELKFMQPIPMVTKEEVEAEKDALRAASARPIKKLLEAKARKKKRALARVEKARAKANAVADQEDIPMGRRMREVAKIMNRAKADPGKGAGKKTGRGREKGRKGPPKDKRMLADLRGLKRAQKKGHGRMPTGVGKKAARKKASAGKAGAGRAGK